MTLALPTAGGLHIGPPDILTAIRTGQLKRSLGSKVYLWAHKYLLQPDGPKAGEPWDFTDEQTRFLTWWYALDERGRFVYRSGMLRRMKGWGKDPFAAAIACIEFLGPCRFSHFDSDGKVAAREHDAAWVQIAAVSRDQTRNTMTLFPGMLSSRAIQDYDIDLGKEIIYAKHGRRRIEAVTSSPRALEGQRSTFVIKNETHLWVDANEGHAMSEVIARNLAKSRDGSARALAITNAHDPNEDSDAKRDYDTYVAMASGRTKGSGFLYDSLEAPADTVLSDPESLRAGLLAARGDSVWLDVDRLVEEIYDPRTRPSIARRFYLNQIVAGEGSWIAPHEWDACADRSKAVALKEEITLGFDGSKSRDHTALVGCRVSDSHLFTLGIWDPEQYPDGEIPRELIDGEVDNAFASYDVVGFFSDVSPWESYVDAWNQRFGEQLCVAATGKHKVGWDMRSRTREITQAVEAFHSAVMEHDLTHEGNSRASWYVYNAKRRPNQYGITFGKESPDSANKVDWLAAAVLARLARQQYLILPESRRRRSASFSIYVPGDE